MRPRIRSAELPPGEPLVVLDEVHKYPRWRNLVKGIWDTEKSIRHRDRREVDFVVLRDRRPVFAVECKSGDRAIGPAVRYFAERTPIPRFYQVHRSARSFSSGKITVMPFPRFCAELGMP